MDAAPPPLSPPPALEATTIGKYIARFRYEKPQPREARVAAQRSDFWWTRSPRYARSPPRSPSTWASGGDFAFPEGEEEEEKEEEEIEGKINVNITTEEEEKEAGVEDGDSSVDSVESKLRRRLGVWGSDSSLGGEGPNSANVLQAWGSVDWSSVDLEEEPDDEEGEDPEEVIERVRRRLGWASTTASGASAASQLRPVEFRLSIDKSSQREEPRRLLGRKPPLSPGSCRKGEPLERFDFRSTSSWGSVERERELDEHFEEVKSPSVGSVDGREHVAGKEGKEENGQSPVARSEGEPAARGNVSSAKGGDTKGFHTDVSAVGLRDEGLGSSGLSVGSRCSEQHEPVEGRCNNSILPANESNAVAMNDESSCSDEREIKAVPDVKKKELQSQNNAQERISFDDVPELPLPLTTSPARPEPVLDSALPWSGGNLSDRSHESSISSRGQDGSIPTETASTLDSLVSLVVHSWEHDFFSESASEQREGVTPKKASDKPLAAANTPTQPNETHLPHVNEATDSSGVQCSSPVPNAEESYQASVSADNVDEQLNGMTEFEQHNEDDAEDSEVPGEEDDQIVQMLLERIALLEEALRQTDS